MVRVLPISRMTDEGKNLVVLPLSTTYMYHV